MSKPHRSETTQKIKSMLKAGDTPQDIADALKISPRRVYQVRGEKRREPMSPVKAVAIRAAIMAGRSQLDIAGEFKVSKKTVAKIRAELPRETAAKVLPPPPKPKGRVPAETIAHILARSRANRSVGTIAREVEMNESAVRQILKRHPRTKVRPGDSIMAAIVREMEQRGLSAHGLAELVQPPPTSEVLHNCLRGDSPMITWIASRILEALGLEVRKRA